MSKESQRETYIVSLYLSKFDADAVKELGCKTRTEAFRKIAQALNAKEATIKNIRDYFDTFFPNKRQGWRNIEPYKMIRDIFDEFGNYDFKNLTIIVKNILKEDSPFSIYDNYKDSTINNFSNTEREYLKQVFEIEKTQKQMERSPEEEKCVLALKKIEGGKREVAIFDCKSRSLVGIADLITDKEIIEVKNINNWKHALGQIFTYWYYFYYTTNMYLIPRVHLFGGNGIADNKINLCQSLIEEIFSTHTNLIPKVTHAEEFQDFEKFD